jgi:asparagine synthase (glutamine-hydrolysing)
VLFSGGVDSALVAVAASAGAKVQLLTVGRAGSPDITAAESAAQLLRLPWSARVVEDAEISAAMQRYGLRSEPEPRRSVLVSFALAFGAEAPNPWLVGQGADELFGGYAHFRGLSEERFRERQTDDWRRLVELDWPATQALAHVQGRVLGAPFLDEPFAARARTLGTSVSADTAVLTKPALRAWAERRGVPRSIAERPKRAIQYGTGISATVRRLARD